MLTAQISCSQQLLPAAGCAFADIRTCLCLNTTLQYQLASCVQTSCNREEQFGIILKRAYARCHFLKLYSCDNRLPKYYVQRCPATFAQCGNFSDRYSYIFNNFSDYCLAVAVTMAYITALLGRLGDACERRKSSQNSLDARADMRLGYNDTNGCYTNL